MKVLCLAFLLVVVVVAESDVHKGLLVAEETTKTLPKEELKPVKRQIGPNFRPYISPSTTYGPASQIFNSNGPIVEHISNPLNTPIDNNLTKPRQFRKEQVINRPQHISNPQSFNNAQIFNNQHRFINLQNRDNQQRFINPQSVNNQQRFANQQQGFNNQKQSFINPQQSFNNPQQNIAKPHTLNNQQQTFSNPQSFNNQQNFNNQQRFTTQHSFNPFSHEQRPFFISQFNNEHFNGYFGQYTKPCDTDSIHHSRHHFNHNSPDNHFSPNTQEFRHPQLQYSGNNQFQGNQDRQFFNGVFNKIQQEPRLNEFNDNLSNDRGVAIDQEPRPDFSVVLA